MTDKLSKILLVEDNLKYVAGALDFFKDNAWVHVAADYQTAMYGVNQGPVSGGKYNGAIVDCFFPRVTGGSNDRELGKLAIEKMLANDTQGQREDRYEKAFEPYLDLNDPELRRLARYIGSRSDEDNPEDYVVFRAIKAVGETVGKEMNSHLQRQNLKTIFRKGLIEFKDHYEALRQGLENDPANQALGILVAEECEKRKIPFVLATSTYHHDEMTQPIQDYCGRKGWTLVDCNQGREQDKASPEFWQRVYDQLLRRVG